MNTTYAPETMTKPEIVDALIALGEVKSKNSVKAVPVADLRARLVKAVEIAEIETLLEPVGDQPVEDAEVETKASWPMKRSRRIPGTEITGVPVSRNDKGRWVEFDLLDAGGKKVGTAYLQSGVKGRAYALVKKATEDTPLYANLTAAAKAVA